MTETSRDLNVNYKTVEYVKRKYKLQVNKEITNHVNHHFLDNIDSEIKAYFLGFFIADGYIGKEGRVTFSISKDDEIILHKFREQLKVNSIEYCNDQKGVKYRKPQAKYRFTSTILRDCLKSKYNINSPKTYDYTFKFPFETIPKEFLGSFIRGLWDGDGSFESHGFVFNPTCSINSSIFAKQVGEIIKAHTGLDYKIYTIQGKTCIYNTLRLHANRINKKEKVQKLYNFLYDNATIFLQRKKDKVLRYLEYRANSDVNKSEQCNA